jgi:hypothetical protein
MQTSILNVCSKHFKERMKQVHSPIRILISLVTALQVMAVPLQPKDYTAMARPTGAMPDQLGAKKRDLTDVSIGGIKIGMTLQQVTNKLGKPTKTSQILDPCTGQNRITLRYDRLIINILGETVLEIESSNPLYQTGRKIKVGDPLSKAKNTYDKILSTPSTLNEESQEFMYNKSADGILRFKSRLGRITSISIAVNAC